MLTAGCATRCPRISQARRAVRVPRAPAAAFSTAPAKDPAYALGTPEVDPLQQMLVESLKARRDFINASVSSLKLDEDVLERGDEWAKQKIALEKQFGIANKFQEMEAAFKMAQARAGSMRELLMLARDTMVDTLRYSSYDSLHGELMAELDRIEREIGVEVPLPQMEPADEDEEAAQDEFHDFFLEKMEEPEIAAFCEMSEEAQLVDFYKAQLEVLVDDIQSKIKAREDKLKKLVMKTIAGNGDESFTPSPEDEAMLKEMKLK